MRFVLIIFTCANALRPNLINPQTMENNEVVLLKRQKKLIVTLVLLVLLTLASMMYAFVQQGIARENAEAAIVLGKRLSKSEESVLSHQKRADELQKKLNEAASNTHHAEDLAATLAAEANARRIKAEASSRKK
jgi:hypothetical protein